MIRGVHHTAIHTSDLERLIAFYRGVIGFEVVARYEWQNEPLVDEVIGVQGSSARAAMLRAGNCYLELFQYARPAPRVQEPLQPHDRGYTHICLDVTDIQREYERLKRCGMSFNRSPGDFGNLFAVYGRDPDGNIVEIQETGPDHEFALARLQM